MFLHCIEYHCVCVCVCVCARPQYSDTSECFSGEDITQMYVLVGNVLVTSLYLSKSQHLKTVILN